MPASLPGRWPRPSHEAREILQLAFESALTRGFFGAEHLAGALAQLPWPGHPLIGQSGPVLRRISAQLGETRPLSEAACWLTPRMALFVSRLSPGFTPEDLLFSLARIPYIASQLPRNIVEQAQARIEEETTLHRPFSPGNLHLEVEGGPDDGRVLVVAPHHSIGRWDGQSSDENTLFYQKNIIDPYVSRRHLHSTGGLTITPHAPTTRIRACDPEPLPLDQPAVLKHSDRLVLGISTRLHILG